MINPYMPPQGSPIPQQNNTGGGNPYMMPQQGATQEQQLPQDQSNGLMKNYVTGEMVPDFNSASPFDPSMGSGNLSEAFSAGSFFDKLDIMNRGFQKYAIGGLQLLNSAIDHTIGNMPFMGNAVHDSSAALNQELLAQDAQGQAAYDTAIAKHPVDKYLMGPVGEIGGATIAATPSMMNGAGMMTQAAAGGYTAGIMQPADNNDQRLAQGIEASAGSTALTGAFKGGSYLLDQALNKVGASSYIQKLFSPKTAAKQDTANAVLLDNANNPDVAQAALLNVDQNGMTLGEQLGTGQSQVGKLRELESNIKVGEGEKGPIAASIVPRVNQAKQDIYDLVDNMANKDTVINKDQAFSNMRGQYVSQDNGILQGTSSIPQKIVQLLNKQPKMEGIPDNSPMKLNIISKQINKKLASLPETVLKDPQRTELLQAKKQLNDYMKPPEIIQNNPVLSSYMKKVRNSSAPELSGLENNSVAQLHKVDQLLKERMMRSKPDSTGTVVQPLKGTEGYDIRNAQRQLRSVLSQSDEYNKAMALNSKIETQKYFQTRLGLKKTSKGMQGKMTLEQVLDSLAPQDLLKKNFMKSVIKTGGDPEQVAEIMKTAEQLKDSPLWSPLKGSMSTKETYLGNGPIGAGQNFISNLTMGRYQRALLEVTLNGPKYAPEIAKIIGSKGIEKEGHLINLLGNIMSTSAAVRGTDNANQ